jgi:hypothetical protein
MAIFGENASNPPCKLLYAKHLRAVSEDGQPVAIFGNFREKSGHLRGNTRKTAENEAKLSCSPVAPPSALDAFGSLISRAMGSRASTYPKRYRTTALRNAVNPKSLMNLQNSARSAHSTIDSYKTCNVTLTSWSF